MIVGGVASAKGFRAAGVPAEIKYAGRNDVALVVADSTCNAAAAFTTNRVAAAPVVYDREVMKRGRARAILANSGCANACTGAAGLRDAKVSALATAGELGIDPGEVLVASTGVIGRRLPMERLLAGMKRAAASLGRTRAHSLAAEKAVMTTDTRPKEACATTTIGGRKITVGGMAKGSGMIEPNMATMLGFITTDAAVSATMLKRALTLAIARRSAFIVNGLRISPRRRWSYDRYGGEEIEDNFLFDALYAARAAGTWLSQVDCERSSLAYLRAETISRIRKLRKLLKK